MKKFRRIKQIANFSVEKRSVIEEIIGVELPKDLIYFICKNNAGLANSQCFQTEGGDIILFGRVFDFEDPMDSKESPFSCYNSFKNRIPKGLFPFAEEPSGDIYCFGKPKESEDSKKGIYYHYHEGKVLNNRENKFKTIFLFNSITQLVDRLKNCEEFEDDSYDDLEDIFPGLT